MQGKSNTLLIVAAVVAVVVVAGIFLTSPGLLSGVGVDLTPSSQAEAPVAELTEQITGNAAASDESTEKGATEEETIVESETGPAVSGPADEEVAESGPTTHVVEMSSSGFSPASIEIKKGDTVNFVAIDSGIWPASALHPTHTVYPGSGITKCGGDDKIFDACEGVGQGGTFSFTFNEVGDWKYHDHLNPSRTGSVVVTE